MKNKINILRLISFIILIGISISLNAQTTYYVDKSHSNANDSNSGTENEPWLTIQKAADVVGPGDIVYIKEGIYYEQVQLKNSGTPDNMIHISAYAGHTPVIDGSEVFTANWSVHQGNIYKANVTKDRRVLIIDDVPQNPVQFLEHESRNQLDEPGEYYYDTSEKMLYCMTLSGDSPQNHILRGTTPDKEYGIYCKTYPYDIEFTEINGLTIRYTHNIGIYNEGRYEGYHRNFIVRNCHIAYSGAKNIVIRKGDGDVIDNCILEHSYSYGSRSINIYECKNSVLKNSIIRKGRCDLVNITSSEDILISGNQIYDNVFYTSNHPDLIQIQSTPAMPRNKNITIEKNLFHTSSTGQWMMVAYVDGLYFRNNIVDANVNLTLDYYNTNIYFYNNTMPNNALRINETTPGATVKVRVFNNILAYGNYQSTIQDFKSDYNIYANENDGVIKCQARYGSGIPYPWPPGTPQPMSLALFNELTGNGEHSIQLTSKEALNFVDFDNRNYQLTALSPAKDAGMNLSAYFTTDKDSILRPQSSAWDIGAYEYDLGQTPVAETEDEIFILHDFYPNPTSGETNIPLDVLETAYFKLDIMNIHGQHIRNIQNGELTPGEYEFEWDGKNANGSKAATGTYFVTIQINDVRKLGKTVMIK